MAELACEKQAFNSANPIQPHLLERYSLLGLAI
jgi:hypothetical protein